MKRYIIILILLFCGCRSSKPLLQEETQLKINTEENTKEHFKISKNTIDSLKTEINNELTHNIDIIQKVIKFDTSGKIKEIIETNIKSSKKEKKEEQTIKKVDEHIDMVGDRNINTNFNIEEKVKTKETTKFNMFHIILMTIGGCLLLFLVYKFFLKR